MRALFGLALFLFSSAAVFAVSSPVDPTQPGSYRQPAIQELVRTVNAAAALVRQQGEAVFAEFRRPGRWFRGQEGFYLFVFDLDGNQVVNAAFPETEVNRLHWTDAWGKPLFQLAIHKLSPAHENRPYWWIHYLWPKPGSTVPSWKSTYMVRTQTPAGRTYVVAAGLYDVATEPLWIELLVDEAADLITTKSDAAFPIISSPSSPFMYRDSYVFVFNEHGVELATGAFPELIGTHLLQQPDFPLKQLIRDQIAFVQQHGTGWMTGSWPRPGESKAVAEQIYLRGVRHNDTLLIIGSGIYR
jgi:signal transduction histidine kinase